MSREQSRRVSPNVSGRTRTQAPVPRVHAQPVDTTIAPESRGFSQLAEGLRSFSPGFNSYLQKKQSQFIADEQAKGVQAASLSRDEYNEKIAKGELSPEQSPYFQKAYMTQSGINAGMRRRRELIQAYNDPAKFNRDSGDINEFLAGQLNADVEGLEDTDFKSGYLKAIKQTEEFIRDDFTKHNIESVRGDVKDQVFQAYSNAFEAMAMAGNWDVANLDVLSENGQLLNLERSELNDIAFKAAAAFALSGEGHPEVFELFKHKGKNGVASLAFTQDYKTEVERLQERASAISNARKTSLNNQLKFETEMKLKEAIDNGTHMTYKDLVSHIFDAESNPEGVISSDQAKQLLNYQQKKLDELESDSHKKMYFGFKQRLEAGELIPDDELINSDLSIGETNTLTKYGADRRAWLREEKSIDRAILTGDTTLLTGMSESRIEESLSKRFTNALGETQDQVQALESVISDTHILGVKIPQVDNLLSTADPSNTATWATAVSVYRTLKEQHPTYLAKTFNNTEMSALFDMYIDDVAMNGYGEEEAAARLASMTKGDKEAAQTMLGNYKMVGKMHEAVRKEFGDGVGARLASRAVSSYIQSALRYKDGRGFSEHLIDKAVDHVKSRVVTIGESTYLVEDKVVSTPHLKEAIEDSLSDFWREKFPNSLLEPTHLVPDSSSDTMLALSGVNLLPHKVNVKELVDYYKRQSGITLPLGQLEYMGVNARIDAIRDEMTLMVNRQSNVRGQKVGDMDQDRFNTLSKELNSLELQAYALEANL